LVEPAELRAWSDAQLFEQAVFQLPEKSYGSGAIVKRKMSLHAGPNGLLLPGVYR
jgi:hypothetical protein